MDAQQIHGAFEDLAAEERFRELPIAFHIEPGRDLSTYEIVVDARRALHVIPALTEFATGHGLMCHASGGEVVMSPGRTRH
jgi:hypothetical protein